MIADRLLDVLPQTAATTPDGRLGVGGCALADLAGEFGTPAFVFDEQGLRATCYGNHDHGNMTTVMKRITATQFKAQALALLDEAAAGEEIVVTKHGRPVARVVSAQPPADLRGSVTFHVDDDVLIEPLDVDWDADG